MTRLLFMLLTLLFSLSGPATGGYSDFWHSTLAAKGGELIVRNPIGKHAAEQMAERGISGKMVQKAIEKGQKFYDSKNGTIQHVLDKGFASGKTLDVGTNPVTGKVTTAIRKTKFNANNPRYTPVE